MILLDRRVTIDEEGHVLQIIHSSAYDMMHSKLRFHKVCARCVPKQLAVMHKQTRIDILQKHLNRYGNERDIFLDIVYIIVTSYNQVFPLLTV